MKTMIKVLQHAKGVVILYVSIVFTSAALFLCAFGRNAANVGNFLSFTSEYYHFSDIIRSLTTMTIFTSNRQMLSDIGEAYGIINLNFIRFVVFIGIMTYVSYFICGMTIHLFKEEGFVELRSKHLNLRMLRHRAGTVAAFRLLDIDGDAKLYRKVGLYV